MELILWRHAEAADGDDDLARPLTKKGRRQARAMATWLKTHLPKTAQVYASEALRSQQTAQFLQDHPKIESILNPDSHWQKILPWCFSLNRKQPVVIIGHQPWMGHLCARLLLSNPDSDNAMGGINIKKGMIWWIQIDMDKNIFSAKVRTVRTPFKP